MTISNETPCRGCGAPIRFIRTTKGGKMPVEATPFKLVVMVTVNRIDRLFIKRPDKENALGRLVDCYEPHWGNCEKAEDFKT